MQIELRAKLLLVGVSLLVVGTAVRPQTLETSQAPPVEALDPVTITARQEIELPSSYKALYRGMLAVLEAKTELGPNAVVSLKLQVAAESNEAKISLVSANTDIQIPLRDDLTFELPMSEPLLAEDPRFLVAGAGKTPTIALTVQTPGTPQGATRMGDLRLACAFVTGVRTEMASGLNRTMLGLFGTRTCRVHFSDEGGLVKVSLTFNGRSTALESKNGKVEIPVHRTRYPNDALILASRAQSQSAASAP